MTVFPSDKLQSQTTHTSRYTRAAGQSAANARPGARIGKTTADTSRTQGDRQLAASVVSAFRAHNGKYTAPVHIPAHSTLGEWRNQLVNALNNPDFQSWLQQRGIVPSSIVLYPGTNNISVIINKKREIITRGNDAEWAALSGPIMAAAKVITCGEHKPIFYNDAFSKTVHLGEVAAFYGVKNLDKPAVNQLESSQHFAPIASTDTGRSDAVRGKSALAKQQHVVGSIHIRHNQNILVATLSTLAVAIGNGSLTNQEIAAVLNAKKIDVSLDNTYRAAKPSSDDTQVGLAEYIVANGGAVPHSVEQINALKQTIIAPEPTAPADDNRVPPGDAQLIEGYTGALQRQLAGDPPGLIRVPSGTVLGQWLEHYRGLVEHPVVQKWMQQQKIDPATLSIVPSTGAMSAKVDGVLKHFSLTDTSGWRQIAAPLLNAGKIIAPVPDQPLSVSFETGFMTTSVEIVATFYGEPTPANMAEGRQRITQLNTQKTFTAPPNEKQSATALEAQRGSAKKRYTEAPQKLAYSKLARGVAENFPNPRALAKQLAEKILREHLPKEQLAKLEPLDADKLYLNQFYGGASSPGTRSGWEHPNEVPHTSKTLTEAVLGNFTEQDAIPGELDNKGGIYTEGPGQHPKKGYGAHNEFPLDPSVFMRSVWKADFQSIVTKKTDEFWTAHGADYRTVVKGEFVSEARQQLKSFAAKPSAEQALQADEHKFTRSDYQRVIAATSNLPLDENAPLTVAQLRADAPVKGNVQVHAFDINGFKSSDILHFSAPDGWQSLYIPGAKPAFLRFDSLEKMDQWVVEQGKEPQKRKALETHFSLADRQDNDTGGFWRALLHVVSPITHLIGEKRPREGVDTSLEHLGTGAVEKREGTVIDRSNFAITGDAFSTLRDTAQHRMISDADTAIKSNSEVTRDTWLNDLSATAGLFAKLAPLGAPVAAAAIATGLTEAILGTEKTLSGDSEAERRDGASKAFDGVLNTLFSLGASGAAEDPFALPEEQTTPSGKPSTPVQEPEIKAPQAGPSGTSAVRNLPDATVRPSSSLMKMSNYALPDGEQLIENAIRDAKGVYRVLDSKGVYRQFVRYTDETGTSKVFEIESRYRTGESVTSIINPKTGRAAMKVNPGREGEWARAPGDGGVKWPWERTPSPTPSDDMKSPSPFANQFRDLDGKKLPAGERADEFLKFSEGSHYEFASNNYEENGVIKANARVSWNLDETGFAVEAGEKAQITEHSSSEYSPNFVLDINRNPYTVTTAENRLLNTQRLNAGADSAEGIRQARLKQFEEAIPDATLRARISEVAHQGSIAPATIDLNGGSVLQDGFYFGADDTQFHIDHAPARDVTTVRITSKGHLANPEQDINHVPGVEVTITRTFTIRASNELNTPYVIDKNAPTNIEVSVAPGP